MGRLTGRNKNGDVGLINDKQSVTSIEVVENVEAALDKLAHYEDLEEAGRLIEVVRCSECEHYDTVGCADGCGWCNCWDIGRFTDGYCDKSKLKELEGDKE